MNKSLQKILALSVFVLGFGAAATALADDKVCTTCHDESWEKPILSIYQTRHGVKTDGRTPGCQTCHGTSDGHLKSPSTAPDMTFKANSANPSEAKNATCLGCHKAGNRSHWEGSAHAGRDVTCASCHTVHAAKDKVLSKKTQFEVCFTCHKNERAQNQHISHHPVIEGKVACSDCHNPHGSIGPKMLVKNGVNATCYTCHVEKRGPLLWEHAPVTDDCTNCHSPHGSTMAPMLKARVPFLCQECHVNEHASSLVVSGNVLTGGAVTTTLGQQQPGGQSPGNRLGRSCLSCHVQIHGSNHPAGAKFNR